jgi:hypothetical protein
MPTSLSEIKTTTAHRIGWFQALTKETNSTLNVSNETEIEMPNASSLLIHSIVGSSIQVAQGTDLQLRLGRVGEILKIFDVAPWCRLKVSAIPNSLLRLCHVLKLIGGLEHGF